MTQMSSGKVLRETRERKGYDLNTVARRLRIRPDILRSIEAGDFASMPPRGYTRNMVNAYARLLGLNPTEIVNMYLDEAYAAQVEKARGREPSSGFSVDTSRRAASRRARGLRDVAGTGVIAGLDDGQGPVRQTYTDGGARYTRALYDDRTPFSHDGYGIKRERAERPGKSERDFMSHHSGYSAGDYGSAGSPTTAAVRPVHVGQTPMEYSASRLPSFLQSRIALVLAVVAVVAVIAVVAFVVLGNRNAPAENDVAKLPVSGISDTTGTADDDSATGLVEVAPSSSRVVLSVRQGEECYLEAYGENNATTPYMLTGPAQENIEVTGVLTIATWTPEYVKVTVDGAEVELTSNDDYNGMYAYTVDFPKILEEWRATHTSKEAQRSAAIATAETGASQPTAQQAEPVAEDQGQEPEDGGEPEDEGPEEG